jgi:hypothetical protein
MTTFKVGDKVRVYSWTAPRKLIGIGRIGEVVPFLKGYDGPVACIAVPDHSRRFLRSFGELEMATSERAPMKTIEWITEPKGPGRAVHMFLDAAGERVELLAYDCPHSQGGRMCGFEVYTRLRKGGPFHNQIAAGETQSLDEAKAAALAMVAQPREKWTVLSRSWVA